MPGQLTVDDWLVALPNLRRSGNESCGLSTLWWSRPFPRPCG